MTHYERLQVTESASPEIIRAAYRELAAKYHPDNQATGDAETMKALNTAKEILLDEQKRRAYDLTLIAGRRRAGAADWVHPGGGVGQQDWGEGYPGGAAAYPGAYPDAGPMPFDPNVFARVVTAGMFEQMLNTIPGPMGDLLRRGREAAMREQQQRAQREQEEKEGRQR